MTPTKPYLVRAFYEWIADNDCTPHVVVNAEIPGVDVPLEYVENGQIVLNVSMMAVQSLSLDNDSISFKAKFDGVSKHVFIPMHGVMAIYAKENGRGMVFPEEELDDDDPPPENKNLKLNKPSKKNKSGKPHLTIVKDDD